MEPRAYSLFDVKSIDEESRVIEGWASTPSLDRGGDVMDPHGAKFKLPQPLFYMHRHDEPIGDVFSAQPSAKGIYIKARIDKNTALPYVERAWTQIKHRLMRGLSIDWRPLDAPEIKSGTRRYASWEWVGTSVVSIPMNADATIALVKSIDAASLAASGTGPRIPSTPPGASGQPPQARPMTSSEQLTQAKAELGTKTARLKELCDLDRTDGGLSTDDATERDTLMPVVEGLTKSVKYLTTLEQAMAAQAGMITIPSSAEGRRIHLASEEIPKVQVKALPKGTAFVRYAMAVAAGKGSYSDTLAYAKRWEGQTPEVVKHVKQMFGKAVEGTASSAASPNWGSELVYANNLASEFIDMLNAETVMGRIPGFRRIPFNVRMVKKTQHSTVNWVGESDVKPVGELDFTTVVQPWHKIAGIVVLTEELVRLSDPSAEAAVRDDLVEQIAQFKDQQFLDPSVTGTANRPASITNGVPSPAASGTTAEDFRSDMNAALANFDNASQATRSIVVVTTPAIARGLSTLTNALGNPEFPLITMSGGTIMGFPVIVSGNVPSGHVILIAASEIFLSEDPNVSLDASNQATIDMAGGTSPTFSLWQRNCIGIRAEQFATWQERRDPSVAVIDGAAYGPTAP